MVNNAMYKLLPVAVLAASLAACGSSSSSSNSSGGTTATANLSSNPSFVFDQTTYVGAVAPTATSAWYSFALAGSYPTASEIVSSGAIKGWTNTVAADATANMGGITPADSCPTLASGTVVQEKDAVTVDGSSFVKCRLSGSISSDVTLSNDVIWSLVGQVVVGNGNKQLTADNIASVENVTMTVEAGTVFMSKSGSSLIVSRGSKLMAEGTEDHPIIMSGDTTETFAGADTGDGEWGGLVIQGFAYNNLCGDPAANTYCNRVGEGDAGYFGGFDNSDNSGSLKYLIVTEAGAQTGADGDELNGISFQAVGYNTAVDYVQINNNYDDGIELFGGAVDLKHVVVTEAKDDSIDWDEGYVGNIQYALIVQTVSQDQDGSHHVFEMDTKGDALQSAYQESNPTVANVTALATRNGLAASNGLQQKEGTEGQFFNIFMGGDINDCLYVKDNTIGTSYSPREAAYNGIYCVGAANAASIGTADSEYSNVASTIETDISYFVLNSELALTATPATAFTIASKEVDGSAN
jgi:hypothetical protein